MILLHLLLLLTIYYSSVNGQTDPNCPTIDISPCVCSTYTVYYANSVQIDCSNKGLSDNALSGILTKIPATTRVGFFQLSGNSLTATPDLTKFTASPSSPSVYLYLLKIDISNNPILTLDLYKFPSSKTGPVNLVASNLSITSVDLARVALATKYIPLCQLDLSGNKQLTSVTNARNTIDTCGNDPPNVGPGFLLLNNCAITQITRGSGSYIYALGQTDATVDLSHNAITNIDNFFLRVIANSGTAKVDLSFNQITTIPTNAIYSISGTKGVIVNFSNNNLTTLDAAVFKGRNSGGKLKFNCPSCPTFVMNFSSNQITSITNGPLELDNSGTDGTQPIVIDLSSNAFTSFDGQWLSVTGSANLILDNNRIANVTNAPLVMPGTKGNAAISMRNNGIKSFDASWFSSSSSSSLTSALIDVSNNSITSVTSPAGSSLPAWVTNNTAVDLRNNGITQLGSAFFCPIVSARLKNGHNPATSFIRVDASKGRYSIPFAAQLYNYYWLNFKTWPR